MLDNDINSFNKQFRDYKIWAHRPTYILGHGDPLKKEKKEEKKTNKRKQPYFCHHPLVAFGMVKHRESGVVNIVPTIIVSEVRFVACIISSVRKII